MISECKGLFLIWCYGLSIYSPPPYLYVEILIFAVMIFRDGAFGRLIRSCGWAPHDRISVFIKIELATSPSLHNVKIEQEGTENQKENSHQNLTMLTP